MSKSSCWKGGEPPLSRMDLVRGARAQRWWSRYLLPARSEVQWYVLCTYLWVQIVHARILSTPLPHFHRCFAVLAWVTGVQSWWELWETSAGLTLIFKAAFRPWLRHTTPPPSPRLCWADHHSDPNSIPSCLPGHVQGLRWWLEVAGPLPALVSTSSLAQLTSLGAAGMGWLEREGSTPSWQNYGPSLAPAVPHAPWSRDGEMQKVVCCSPQWHIYGYSGSKVRFLLIEIHLFIGVSFESANLLFSLAMLRWFYSYIESGEASANSQRSKLCFNTWLWDWCHWQNFVFFNHGLLYTSPGLLTSNGMHLSQKGKRVFVQGVARQIDRTLN